MLKCTRGLVWGERVGVIVYKGFSVGREGRCNSVPGV